MVLISSHSAKYRDMKHLYLLVILFTYISCHQTSPATNEIIEIIDDFSVLKERLDSDTTRTWVVNFWATTCPPCIKEMPHFAELQSQHDAEDLKVLLVSLDSPRSHEKRVIPFVKKHNITPEVMHLTDDNFSAWTDEVDPSWFGALPATLILKGSKRHFQFGMYESKDDLDRAIAQVQ